MILVILLHLRNKIFAEICIICQKGIFIYYGVGTRSPQGRHQIVGYHPETTPHSWRSRSSVVLSDACMVWFNIPGHTYCARRVRSWNQRQTDLVTIRSSISLIPWRSRFWSKLHQAKKGDGALRRRSPREHEMKGHRSRDMFDNIR